MPTIDLLGGKLQLYQRDSSRFWQARASVGSKQRQFSTKRESFEQASRIAEDWYLTLVAKQRVGTLDSGPTFKKAADQFQKEYAVITEGERSDKWTESHAIRLRLHLVPFFGNFPLNKVTPGKVQEYRVHRMTLRVSQTLDSDSANSRTVVSLKSGQFDGMGRRVPGYPQG